MAKFKLRIVDGEYKAGQPWYDYLACCNYITKHSGTLEEAQSALFDVWVKA